MNTDDLGAAKRNGQTIECSYCGEEKINRPGHVKVIGTLQSTVESAKQEDFRVICTACEIKATDAALKPKAEPKAPAKKKA